MVTHFLPAKWNMRLMGTIQTYLFDGSGMTNDEKVQEYANQVVNTLDEIEEKYPYINFDLGVAIIVWDSDFKVNFFYS